MSVAEKLPEAALEHKQTVDRAARIGLAARGSLYVIVGLLAARVALGDRGEAADRRGAIAAIARQPLGRVLLVLLIIGLLGYGFWRLSRAIRPDEDENVFKRIGHVVTAGLYGVYAAACVGQLVGSSNKTGGGGNGPHERSLTAKVLAWGVGPAIVIGVGLGCWAFAAWRFYRAATGDFEDHLRSGMERWVRTVVVQLGRVGHAATGAVIALLGWFFIQAGRQHDPNEAKSLDESLKDLASRANGPLLLLLVAVGLISFGLWCLGEAKYRSPSET